MVGFPSHIRTISATVKTALSFPAVSRQHWTRENAPWNTTGEVLRCEWVSLLEYADREGIITQNACLTRQENREKNDYEKEYWAADGSGVAGYSLRRELRRVPEGKDCRNLVPEL